MLSFINGKRERYIFLAICFMAVLAGIVSTVLLINAVTSVDRVMGTFIACIALCCIGVVLQVLKTEKWRPEREQMEKEKSFKEITGFQFLPKGSAEINAMGPVVERVMREKALKALEACREEESEQRWDVDAEINLENLSPRTDLEIAKMKLSAIAVHERNLKRTKKLVEVSKDTFHRVAHLFVDIGFHGIQQNLNAYKPTEEG